MSIGSVLGGGITSIFSSKEHISGVLRLTKVDDHAGRISETIKGAAMLWIYKFE